MAILRQHFERVVQTGGIAIPPRFRRELAAGRRVMPEPLRSFCPHNHQEEGILYPMMDQVFSEPERAEIF